MAKERTMCTWVFEWRTRRGQVSEGVGMKEGKQFMNPEKFHSLSIRIGTA